MAHLFNNALATLYYTSAYFYYDTGDEFGSLCNSDNNGGSIMFEGYFFFLFRSFVLMFYL